MNKDDVPGKTTKEKVRYLMEHEPKMKAKEISEILETSTASIHTARWLINQEKKKNELTDDPFTTVGETPWELPIIPKYEEPTHVHIIEGKVPTFEIALDNMDGATVKALIMIANNKLSNEKNYRINLSIEEK